ncbi:MAG: DUF5666 domain-containing protein [Pseudomonadota bacterium]
MRKINRRVILAGFGASAVGACGSAIELGEAKKKPKGGIGGTGIVGTLTDFGSLIVNGLRVQLSDDSELTDAFGRTGADQLAVGQSLTIEASSSADGLFASRVHVTHPVIGRVIMDERDGGVARVNGIEVLPEAGMIGQLRNGARVAVSGVWQGNRIVGSRVDELPLGGPSVLSGSISPLATGAGVGIGARRILTDSSFLPAPGSYGTVIGDETAQGLAPDRIIPGRFTGAAGPLQALSIEGYLDPIDAAPFYTISGLGHSFDRDVKLAALSDRRAIYSGAYDGDFRAETGLEVPQSLTERRAAMKALLEGETQNPVSLR